MLAFFEKPPNGSVSRACFIPILLFIIVYVFSIMDDGSLLCERGQSISVSKTSYRNYIYIIFTPICIFPHSGKHCHKRRFIHFTCINYTI